MTTLLVLALLVQDPAAEKEARDVLTQAVEALKPVRSISYSVTWHMEDSSRTRFECRVQARRPGHVRQEGAIIATGRNDPTLIVFDGATEWRLSGGKEKRYFRRPQVLNASFSTWEDAVKLFFFDGPSVGWMEFATDLKLKQETLDQVPCSVVEWRIRYTADSRWRLWIDKDARIRRLEKFIGERRIMRVEYADFRINPAIDDAAFRLALPDGAKEDTWQSRYEPKLIAPGHPVPDFEARTLAGKAARLSDWRGKPVLFVTWSFP